MSIGAALEKARMIPVTSLPEDEYQWPIEAFAESEAIPNRVDLLFTQYQELINHAKKHSVDTEQIKITRAEFLNLFAHTDSARVSERELAALQQSVDTLRVAIYSPLVLTLQQRVTPEHTTRVEETIADEEVDFSKLESRNAYFDELGQQVLQLRELANTYFTRFQSVDILWPAYNKIGLQKTSLAEAFFKGNFTNQFNALAAAYDEGREDKIPHLIDNVNRSYDIVLEQIKLVNQQLEAAQADQPETAEVVGESVTHEQTQVVAGIDQTVIRNAARVAFKKAGIPEAEAERRIEASFGAAFLQFKDDPVRLRADVDRIIDNMIAEWEHDHRFEKTTTVPLTETEPVALEQTSDFANETSRQALYDGLIQHTTEIDSLARPVFETLDVAYQLRDVDDLKRSGRRHLKQLVFFETQFKKLFALLPESTDIPTTVHRLNVTYTEVIRQMDAVRLYTDKILEARQVFMASTKTEDSDVALHEKPLEMGEAIERFNQSKILLSERLSYFKKQANRFGFSLVNDTTYLDVMARHDVLPDISTYRDTDSEVSKNILLRYQQKIDQLSKFVDGLEVGLQTFVVGAVESPVVVPEEIIGDTTELPLTDDLPADDDTVAAEFLPVPTAEAVIQPLPMAEQQEESAADQVVFDAEAKLRGIQFIAQEEKATTNFFITSYHNAKAQGATPEVLAVAAKNVKETIDGLAETSDAGYLRERSEAIKQFVSTAGKINFEDVGTITAMYENFVRIADEKAALGTPDDDSVRTAYYSLERMVTNSSSQGYQGYRELDTRPLHEEWREAKHEHEWRSKIYEENLQLHYQALQNRQFGFAKLQYLTQKAFSIKPTLPPDLLQERADSIAATARYSQLAFQMRTKRTEATATESDQENAVLERYQRLLARTLVANTFQNQLEIQKRALTNDEKAPVSRIMQSVRNNRKVSSMAGATVVGGLTGVTGGAAALFRVIGSDTTSPFSAKYVGDVFDKKIVTTTEQLSDDEFNQSIEAIEQLLAKQSLTPEELTGIHEALRAIYVRVDSIKRKKIIAVIGTAIVVGAGTVLAAGLVAGIASGVPGTLDTSSMPTVASEISNTSPHIFDTPPLQPNKPSIPPTPIFTTVGSPAAPPMEIAVSGSTGYGAGAEDIPLDPGITLHESTTVPVPESPVIQTEVTQPIIAAPVVSEVLPQTTHTLIANDNFTHLVKRYGADLLSTLPIAEQNAVIAELVARVNNSPELLSAARIESGDANLLFASIADTPHTIVMDPLLAELKAVVTEKIRADLGAGLESVPAEVSVVEPLMPETIVTSEVAAPEVVAAGADSVPLLQHRITQFIDTYAGGPKAFADHFTSWVDSIQGVHPSIFSRMFTGVNAEHTDAFAALKDMPVSKMRELANLTEAARTAHLGQPDLNVLPADFNKWSMLIRKWSMIPGLVTDDRVTLDTLSKRAFAESMLT